MEEWRQFYWPVQGWPQTRARAPEAGHQGPRGGEAGQGRGHHDEGHQPRGGLGSGESRGAGDSEF